MSMWRGGERSSSERPELGGTMKYALLIYATPGASD